MGGGRKWAGPESKNCKLGIAAAAAKKTERVYLQISLTKKYLGFSPKCSLLREIAQVHFVKKVVFGDTMIIV